MTGRLIAVVGPSGVGKDSVMTAIAARDPRFALARRVITRPSDAGGEAFDGVSLAAFQAQEAAGAFALSWAAHGLHYGIPATVDRLVEAGRDVLANLSRSVLQQAAARFAQVEVISLSARREVLAQRLAARGRETADQIAARLERAPHAMPSSLHVHHIDNSEDLSQTVKTVIAHLHPVGA